MVDMVDMVESKSHLWNKIFLVDHNSWREVIIFRNDFHSMQCDEHVIVPNRNNYSEGVKLIYEYLHD